MVKRKSNNGNSNAVLYGVLAGVGLLVFYVLVVSLFQSVDFALLNIRSLWYLVIPLVIGFGTQIGLYSSIRHTATVTGTAAATGGISAGGMLACCSHFLLNIIPLAGASGLAIFLMKYQPAFLGVGIASSIFGIGLMVKHKKSMKKGLKGGKCH